MRTRRGAASLAALLSAVPRRAVCISSAARSQRGTAVALGRCASARTLSTAAGASVDVLAALANPTEEHAALRASVRAFVESEVEPQALQFNREERFNEPLFRKLGEMGLLGITAGEAYGGSGMDAVATCIAHEELSASDPAFCLSFLAHSLLFVNNLNVNGSEEQKARFLPRACAGELLGGMCMSEPDAGTDVMGMRTTATRAADGQSYTLSGTKLWITNGARDDKETGDAFLVYARSPAPPAGPAKPAYSLFLVEKGLPGFTLGRRLKDKCGMRASNTAELSFDNVVVPLANRVGEEGDALLHMMRNLEIERLALAAMSLGIARRSIDVMSSYAKERKAFGQPLNRFGQIQKHIAESYAEYAAGRAYVYACAGGLDLNAGAGRLDSDGVKLYASVMGTTVANRAMQVLGGNGYMGEYVVERLWRDAKLLEIGGGTVEAHHRNMAKDLAKMEPLGRS